MEETSIFISRGHYYTLFQNPNDYSQAYFVWHQWNEPDKLNYSEIEKSFDFDAHTIAIWDLPENDSVYIQATAIQKFAHNDNGWHDARVRTYVNG